jgi:hypothetical protein
MIRAAPVNRATLHGGLAMKGHDFYNEHSRLQQTADTLGLPLLERAAQEVQLPPPGQVCTLADYGCAGGRNSLQPMRAVIETVRRRAGDRVPIAVVHTDLPTNDFNALFTLLDHSPESYLRGALSVFAYAAGRGFYEQNFPEATVSVGWNAAAVHWLSRTPCAVPGHIWTRPGDNPARKAWAEQSRKDWRHFLELRARELRPGGRLVVLDGLTDESGACGADGVMNLANAVLREMVSDGALQAAEYERMALPAYFRSIPEWEEPFRADDSPRSGALRLEALSRMPVPDCYSLELQRTGDAPAFGAAVAAYLRAFSETSLFGEPDAGRSPVEGQRLADEFYERFARAAAADPTRATSKWEIAVLLIARV